MLINPRVVFTFTRQFFAGFTRVNIKNIFTPLSSYFSLLVVTLVLATRSREFLDLPYSTLPSSLSLLSLSPFLFNCLRLLAAAAVPSGTWRRPAAEGEDGYLAAFLGDQARPGLLLLRANFSQRRRFDLLLAAIHTKH
jgi:hypothetical protein